MTAHLRSTTLAFLSIALLFSGCASMEAPADGEHDSFTGPGGGADGFGVLEGTCEAVGVLAVANSASEERLVSAVGLRETAAYALVERRREVRQFWTLADLDAVPFVGAHAYELLLAYAEANDHVAACERDGGVSPATRAYQIMVDVSATGDAFDAEGGPWQYDEALGEYTHSYEAEIDALPFARTVGDFEARIGADGQMELSYVRGDYDSSARAAVRVPLSAPTGTHYQLDLDGGDHANGAWSVDARIQLVLR